MEESPTGVNAFPDSPDGVEGFPQSPQQQQELQNAPTSPTPLTPQPSPVNLGEDFADEVDTPDIPRFQIRGGIEDNDTDEEEEIVRQQDAQDAIQRFIPMEMPEIVKETLEKLFYDESYTVGRDQLWDLVKEKLPDEEVPRAMVADWLEKQELYQLYRKTRKSRGISSFQMTSPFQRMSIDLIDFSNKSVDRGFKYIFVAIDNFSRYLFTKALTNKTPSQTAKAMREIIKEVKDKFGRNIGHILADRGTEFQGEFRELLKEKKIPSSKTIAGQAQSNSMVERSNGSLKRLLSKHKAIYGGNWKSNLRKVTDVYNNLRNDNSGFRPNQAVKLKEGTQEFEELKRNTEKRQEARKPKNMKRQKPLLTGDVVRVKIPKGVLDKGSTPNWSTGLFIIKDRIESEGKNMRYRLGGYDGGEPRKADELFLREDLQLIKYPSEIQKIPLRFRKEKIKPKPKPPQERQKNEKDKEEEEAKDPVILDETIEVGRRPRRKAKPEDVNNPNNFIGKRVRKLFNDGEYYVGDIYDYDKPYFRVSYEDGQEEDMNLRDVKRYLMQSQS